MFYKIIRFLFAVAVISGTGILMCLICLPQ